MFVAIRFFVAAAFSTLIFWVIGPRYYFSLAALVLIFALVLLIASESHHRQDKAVLPGDEALERAAVDYLTLFGVSMFVGVFWPCTPMFAWGKI